MATAFLGTQNLHPGSQDAAGGGGPVAALQAELRRIGVLPSNDPAAAGLFDPATERAVRRLQWFAGQVPAVAAAAGNWLPRVVTHLAIDGVVGPQVKQFLQTMQANGWKATGLLVKFNFDNLSNVSANSGFTALLGANMGICERSFAETLAGMNAAAHTHDLHVFVNQLFRVEGSAVSGAVVPPAGFSAHKIGRAVDLQLGTSAVPQPGTNPKPSIAIKNAAAGTPFAKFREHAKTVLHCRYGGDFEPIDPPHFDRQIQPGGSATWRLHHYFDQLQFQRALTNPAAIPELGAMA